MYLALSGDDGQGLHAAVERERALMREESSSSEDEDEEFRGGEEAEDSSPEASDEEADDVGGGGRGNRAGPCPGVTGNATVAGWAVEPDGRAAVHDSPGDREHARVSWPTGRCAWQDPQRAVGAHGDDK